MKTKLYTMVTKNKETGQEKIIYGHAAINVIRQFLEAHVDEENDVLISECLKTSLKR